MPAASNSRFSEVPRATIPRSVLPRRFTHKTTFDAGLLVPVFVDEALPGDTFHLRMHAFARLATPIHPIMDNMYLDSHFFFVPYRLVWDNWQKFNGEQTDPGDSTDYAIPRITDGAVVTTGLTLDYFGIPLGLNTTNVRVSSLPFRAYALIWDEWFRDQNMQDSINPPTDDGPDTGAELGTFALQRRGKRHDYFTSCLPWPQKGAAVTLPLGTEAEIFTDAATNAQVTVRNGAGSVNARELDASNAFVQLSGVSGAAGDLLKADLTSATSATINELRQAFQVQKLLERDARGGTRYTEIIKAHFGVTSPDARLQRPEYLGGGTTPVNISPIAQTAETATTPQGNLAAIGTASIRGHGFSKSFTEHGVVIGLVSVRADQTYQYGLERMWSRETRYDFYWPALAHIGEQAVLNKEIYVQNTSADDDVFGYQERYAEYRYKPSMVTGLMRSEAAATLDTWHLAQEYSSLPTLGSTFIVEDPPVDRVIAVPSEPHFIFDSYFDFKSARPMPVYGVPGFTDHF